MNQTTKTLALACLALALAGCFRSKTLLLDLAQAAHPFPDGTWVSNDEDQTAISITTRGQAYLMVEGNSRDDLVLTPLAGHANTYAAAQAEEGCADKADSCEWEYAVVIVDGDQVRYLAPNCESDWAAIEKHVSSRNEAGDTCWFERADGLQQALAAVADRGGDSIVYTRR